MLVLSYAAAHEAGHLLLGDEAHTPQGLLKADWETDDFRAMAQNRFHFSAEQTWELKRRYGEAARPGSVQIPRLQPVIRGRRRMPTASVSSRWQGVSPAG